MSNIFLRERGYTSGGRSIPPFDNCCCKAVAVEDGDVRAVALGVGVSVSGGRMNDNAPPNPPPPLLLRLKLKQMKNSNCDIIIDEGVSLALKWINNVRLIWRR